MNPNEPHPPDQAIFQTLDRCNPAPYSRDEYARRLLWYIVRATLFRLPIPHGHAWRRFLLRWFGARIEFPAGVSRQADIMHPWLLEMGAWSMLGPRVTVYNLGRITIGSHTVVSQDAYLCAGTHDYSKPDLPLVKPEIHIGSGCWVAAGAFVGPGATIGDNTVIGARSVVSGQIPPGVVAAGNPCRVIKQRPMNA